MNYESLAKQAGFKTSQGSYWTNVSGTDENLQRFADLVREACANVCELHGKEVQVICRTEFGDTLRMSLAREFASVIRAL